MDRWTQTGLCFTRWVFAVLALPLLVAMLLPRAVAAQEQQPEEPGAATLTALPAEALTYGADLEEKAIPKLLDWAKKHARELLRDGFSGDELTEESIARRFPSASPAAREAVRFLVGYQAYRRATGQQENRAATLRDIDRDIRELEDRQRLLEASGAPIGTVEAAQREIALAIMQQRLENMQLRRRLAVGSEDKERQLVDACLRWLADAHPRVKDSPPDVLRSVAPPRS